MPLPGRLRRRSGLLHAGGGRRYLRVGPILGRGQPFLVDIRSRLCAGAGTAQENV